MINSKFDLFIFHWGSTENEEKKFKEDLTKELRRVECGLRSTEGTDLKQRQPGKTQEEWLDLKMNNIN